MPPHDLEAEVAVLGAVFLDPAALDEVIGLIRADDFYKPAHGLIYQAMLAAQERREPIDIVTMCNGLRSAGVLEQVGGASYLSFLADRVPSAANVASYARIVQNLAVLRGTIRVLSEYAARAYEPVEDVRAFLNRMESEVLEAATARQSDRPFDMKTTMRDVLKEYERVEQSPDGMSGISIGLRDVDSLLLGLRGGDAVVIAARPSVGKSALASQVVMNAALGGIPGALFTLEMTRVQCGARMLVQHTMLPNYRFRKAALTLEEQQRMMDGAIALSSFPIAIDDTPGITVPEIAAKCRRYKKAFGGLGIVAIDYLQLVSFEGKADSREQEVAKISRQFKNLAKELDAPILILSQLNRKVEDRAGKRIPEMRDLRESGAVEQDADIIIFLHREATYNPLPNNEHTADIIVAKQRNGGAQKSFVVDWNGRSVVFAEPGTVQSGTGWGAPDPDIPSLPPSPSWTDF